MKNRIQLMQKSRRRSECFRRRFLVRLRSIREKAERPNAGYQCQRARTFENTSAGKKPIHDARGKKSMWLYASSPTSGGEELESRRRDG